ALNLGLAHCRGELIARMDADDLVHPDRLRLQAEMLAMDAALGAAGSLIDCIPRPLSPGMARLERWLNQTVTAEQCRNARFIEAPLVHPSATFRRDALQGGWEDHGWAEDWDLQLRMVVRVERELPPPGEALMLCAVGTAGAREEIRGVLETRNYREGEHFLFTA